MMIISNTKYQFSLASIFLHWLIALLIILLLAMGIYMVRIPISALKLQLYGWHKELGFLVLILVCLRLPWRLLNLQPALDELPSWEKFAARSVHWIFYGFMFAIPLSGWLLTSAAGLPMSFFGWFVVPNLISPDENQRILFTKIHQWLSYGLIAVIGLHTAAALKHHFVNRDNILRRMLWP